VYHLDYGPNDHSRHRAQVVSRAGAVADAALRVKCDAASGFRPEHEFADTHAGRS